MTTTAIFCVFLLATWGAFALWFQVPGGVLLQGLGVALWVAFSLAIVVILWRGRLAGGALSFAVAFAALLIWWLQIAPSNNRLWADDVAQTTTGVVDGDRVTLHNVRNFDWRTKTDYTQRWETRTYDLRHLNSLDMILSY